VSSGGLRIATTHGPGRTLLGIGGELDLATAPDLVAAVEQSTPAGGAVEIDLRDVEFMDSSGIAAISRCRRHVDAMDAQMVVRIRAGGPVAQLVEWTGLATVVDITVDP
jgi:anti-anti-sigma factor